MITSRISWHFSLVDARSRSHLHMAGAFITFSDCLVANKILDTAHRPCLLFKRSVEPKEVAFLFLDMVRTRIVYSKVA